MAIKFKSENKKRTTDAELASGDSPEQTISGQVCLQCLGVRTTLKYKVAGDEVVSVEADCNECGNKSWAYNVVDGKVITRALPPEISSMPAPDTAGYKILKQLAIVYPNALSTADITSRLDLQLQTVLNRLVALEYGGRIRRAKEASSHTGGRLWLPSEATAQYFGVFED